MQAMPRMGHLAACVLNGSFRFNRKAIKITAVISMRSATRSASVSPDMQRLMMSQPNVMAITSGGAREESTAAITAGGAMEAAQNQAASFWDTPTIVPTMFHEELSDPEVQEEAMALGKVILLICPLFCLPIWLMRRDRLSVLQGAIGVYEEHQENMKAKLLANQTTIMSLKAKIEALENAPVEAMSDADESAQGSEILHATEVLAMQAEEMSDAGQSVQSSIEAQASTAQGVSDAKDSAQSACSKYAVGVSVEVFSNSFTTWCPGKVMGIENSDGQTLVILEFTWPTGEVATKKLPEEHQDLRIKE
mmetsp:Transcript_7225/g.12438  ORF Transcript_7225/g.12438 Transcript_7225/m.12438 type:complete len:307 (-) Transcript_7225:391-1311(-)